MMTKSAMDQAMKSPAAPKPNMNMGKVGKPPMKSPMEKQPMVQFAPIPR